MVERRTCSFCGNEIEPGTGKLYAKKDGTVFNFCKNKCQKNMLKLNRIPRRVRWSKYYAKK
jgi:large subunit ribosomal protein L24e